MRSFIDAGEEIRQLLHSVVSGHLVDGAALGYAQEVLQGFTSEKTWTEHQLKRQPSGACAQVRFTHREVDILELAASDVPNREIARRLVLSNTP